MKKSILLLTIVSLLAASCKKDDAKISEVTLNAQAIGSNNTFQITDAEEGATFKTEDVNVATVSDKGLISAVRCGETNIDVTEGGATRKVKVTVTPVYNLCSLPDFKVLGATKERVNTYIQKLTGGSGSYGEGGAYIYSMTAQNSFVTSYKFDFNTSTSLCTGISIKLNSASTVNPSDIIKFLCERFDMKNESSSPLKGSVSYFYMGTDSYGDPIGFTYNDQEKSIIFCPLMG